jgi:DNA-directed RNA polymerase specialized sigma subunit
LFGPSFPTRRSSDLIAQKVGISQIHVSRLLAKTLRQLREGLTE